MKRLHRRALLRGSLFGGAVAIGLPWLEAMVPNRAEAQAGNAPKRVVFWFTANGTKQDVWTLQDDLSDIAGHTLHGALAPFKDKLLFLENVDQEIAYNSIGDGHQTGMACLLTNAAINPGTLFCEEGCEAGMEVYVGWGGGQSVDQYIADQIQNTIITKFRSLEFGVHVRSSTVWSRLCYSAGDQPVPPREDPNQNFVDLFSDLDTDPFELERIRKRRKSVLDAVIADYDKFNKRLGYEDRQRLELHVQAIREVEQRLDATGIFGEACEVPTTTLPGDTYNDNVNYPITGRAQMDLLVMALACDMTRVASLQWSGAVSNVRFNNFLPAGSLLLPNDGHHDLSHYDDSDANSQADILTINQWYTDQFAYLLGAMDAVQEGDGTMLDNSVVVWVNELGKGNSHTRSDIPFILAGGCQGYFNTGRHIDFGGAPHGQLLVSLTHAMDTPVQTFGDPAYGTGVLPGLT